MLRKCDMTHSVETLVRCASETYRCESMVGLQKLDTLYSSDWAGYITTFQRENFKI